MVKTMGIPAMAVAVVAALVIGSSPAAESTQRGAATSLTAPALAELIDREVDARLAAENIVASPKSDDAEFMRRVYLDLLGVIPPREKIVEFLDSQDPDKRVKLIDELLASPRFGQHLADIWDAYLLPPNQNSRLSPESFTAWLTDGFNELPWDKLVNELLTATGDMRDNAAVIYMLKGRDPINPAEMANLSGRYFLGVQLACAQCHDHPFTSFKQDDFWGVAGFFSQFEMPGQTRIRNFGITDNTNGSYHLAAFEDRHMLRPPKPINEPPIASDRSTIYRQQFARWVTSPDNPYFAKAMANRLWWQFFGRGIVEPVDDMHPDNPPSHPELLQTLAEQFAASGFDLRHLCRAICNSQTYQRTSQPVESNKSDGKLFSHMAIKVLTPEQIYDSLSTIFGEPARPQGGATGRARDNPRVEFVEFFARESDASPTSYEHGIPQLLRMMNSSQFTDRRGSPSVQARPGATRPTRPLATPTFDSPSRLTAKPAESIDGLYLQVLSRRPTESELAFCNDHLKQGGPMSEILWALINSSEFCLNH
jgi:hypothetical protein